jgi:UDP-3-O-acyl N-acetylglucosamine deacetylase
MDAVRRSERTLRRPTEVRGVSFLSGLDVRVRFRPAPAGTGRIFLRDDLPGRPDVPARVEYVVPRPRRTTIQRGAAVVEMVEHVLAALAGLQIDNCYIDINGPETPGVDGSSLAFTQALDAVGAVVQDRERRVVVLNESVSVSEGSATLTAEPDPDGRMVVAYHLEYDDPTNPIGSQSFEAAMDGTIFRREMAGSRTFLLAAEADALRASGIGSRTSETDLLIFGPTGPIGGNVVRFDNEPARHKALDMVGDLALLGADLVGRITARRSGHKLNADLVRAVIRASSSPVAGVVGPRGSLPAATDAA